MPVTNGPVSALSLIHIFTLFDETMRDGLQNPSVEDPTIDDKLRMLHLMNDVGIDGANLGLPAASGRAFEDVLRLCKEVVDCKMKIAIAAAGRTVVGDITPIVEVSQRAGVKLGVYAFIGSSPIRQYVEQWDVELIAKRSAEAIDVAVEAGLPVAYVTEDTTRSRPDVLTTLFRSAIDHGATRLCLSDTVGHATPDGVRVVTVERHTLPIAVVRVVVARGATGAPPGVAALTAAGLLEGTKWSTAQMCIRDRDVRKAYFDLLPLDRRVVVFILPRADAPRAGRVAGSR